MDGGVWLKGASIRMDGGSMAQGGINEDGRGGVEVQTDITNETLDVCVCVCVEGQ